VLRPAHFDRSGRTRYPVLYLLHGALGNHAVWDSQFLAIVGTLPVIAVMPSGSQIVAGDTLMDGDHSDCFGLPTGSAGVAPAWRPRGARVAPAWESYHIDELLPFTDRTLPTGPTAAGRAVMGISMGGGGAFKYGGRVPGYVRLRGIAVRRTGSPSCPSPRPSCPKTCVHGDPAVDELHLA
jgi:S-formylglutathione hydrolase FrmB